MLLRNLSIGYNNYSQTIEIQKNLNAELINGEFTCLIGPNGAGKTTLLRTMAGFQKPLSGEIFINDRSLSSVSQNELSKIISVVLTERPVLQSTTVKQLVELGRSPYTGFWGRTNNEDQEIVYEALAKVGIMNLKDRRADTLSDGERQKVMIAKSLAQNTQIILLDEPTAFLDFPSKAETMMLLRKLAHDEGKIILQSTHDLNMALTIADRLWLLDKDNGLVVGSPRELSDNGMLERYFKNGVLTFDKESISFGIKF